MDMCALSDETLLAGFAAGDSAAAAAFVRRFQRRVYGLVVTILDDTGAAEDVAQETFVRAWRHAAAYDSRRGLVSTWLLTIARNLALDRAAGDCILFLDSDDFLDPDCVEKLCALIQAHDADIAACGFRFVDAECRAVRPRGRQKGGVRIDSGVDAARMVLYQKELDAMPWAKLYRASVWRNVRFAEDRLYEDLATTYLAFLNAKKAVYDAMPRMTCCLRENSDLRMAFCARKMMMLTTATEIVAYAEKICPALLRAARCRAVAAGFFLYLQMEREHDPAEKERCLKVIRKYRKDVMFDRSARRKTRIAALLSFIGMGAVRMIYHYKKKQDPLF